MRVMVCNPELHYYQGYHDICVTILLVVNGESFTPFLICALHAVHSVLFNQCW